MKTPKRLLFSTMLILAMKTASAANCWDMAAQKYSVDAWLLLSIGWVESKLTSGISSQNSNGTKDFGLMQINTIHVPTYEKLGISQHELQYDTCKNIYAAARHLRIGLDRFGHNIDGIGAYHSYTPKLRRAYGRKVLEAYEMLVQKHYVQKEPIKIKYR